MEMVNISQSGALIDMGSVDQPRWVDIGRSLEFSITHPTTFDLVEVKGKVVRILKDETGTRFAVEFEEMDEAATAGLESLLASACESEAPPRAGPPPLPLG